MPPDEGSSPASDRDSEEFRNLFIPLMGDAYALAYFLCGNAGDADDLVQETYLRALEYFRSFRGGDPRPWLLTILRNCHRAAAGQRGRRDIPLSVVTADDMSPVLEVGQPWSEEQHDPERILIDKCTVETVDGLFAALPEPFREVVVLREIHELSYREISDVVGVPIGTVMSRLTRARDLLRRALLEKEDAKALR